MTRLCAALCVAQKHGFPLPDSGRVFPDTTEAEDDKTCIDVCAEFAGQQDCQTRCVRRVAGTHKPAGLARPTDADAPAFFIHLTEPPPTRSMRAERHVRWHSAPHATGCVHALLAVMTLCHRRR